MQVSAHEELLLARCLKREPEAVSELTKTYGPPLYGFFYAALSGHSRLARKLTPGAFARALEETVPYQEKHIFSVNAVHRVMRDLMEHAGQHDVPDEPASSEAVNGRLGLTLQSLWRLSPEERIFILLRDQLDFSMPEISFCFSIHESEAKKKLMEARLNFRRSLDIILARKKRKR